MDNGNEFLTVPEAAHQILRVSTDTVYELVRQGAIPSIRLGRTIRIPKAALLEHLAAESQRQVAVSHA